MSCPNDEFCGVKSKLSDEYYSHFTHCMTCRSFGWGTLHIHDAHDECSICGEEVSRKLKFPNKDCSHSFCLSCSRNIIFWDETRYHLNPCKYGCPPCPNGCINPERGRQCYCHEYDAIKDTWENENPEDFNKYNDDEDISIQKGEEAGSAFGSGKCPICRRGI